MSNKDVTKEGIDYLKKIINWGGGVLIAFLLIFLVGFFITQCSKQNYTNSLSSIENVTPYKEIDKSVLESSGQTTKTLNTINSNNDAIRSYLNKEVKSQFDNVSNNISALNSQIANLYTILNNSLMIMSIVLGLFTLIIAVFGFYISNVITARYEQIKKAEKDVNLMMSRVKEYNEIIKDALNKNGQKLYKIYRQEHVNSILADLKQNVENIEYYHSELVTNLAYLSFNEVAECFSKLLEIGGTDGGITNGPSGESYPRYINLLLLLDVEKSLDNANILKYLLIHYQRLSNLSFTQLQIFKIVRALINKDYNAQDKRTIASLIQSLFARYNYVAFEFYLRDIDQIDEKKEFIRKLLEFNNEMFGMYIARWKPDYESDKQKYCNQLANIELIEEIKQELSQ
ncbi:MAG: hypothetical protein E6Q33_01290 [Neisseriales bacterium]|nr:MAG: hypothetical protein E6Q33_01290 [Neisseriales bacterium]